MHNHLLIITPQEDLCNPRGALYIDGAIDDMHRLSYYINRYKSNINGITVKLEIKDYINPCFPPYWRDKYGKWPEPHSYITIDDIDNKIWKPICNDISYIKALIANNNNVLRIQPINCLQGTWGANVYSNLIPTLNMWSNYHNKNVNYLYEGIYVKNNFSAEYFIDISKNCDNIIVAGESSSYRIKDHIEGFINTINNKHFNKKIVLLKNCMSPINNSIGLANTKKFFDFVRKSGGTISKVTLPSKDMTQITIDDVIKQRIETVRNIIQ